MNGTRTARWLMGLVALGLLGGCSGLGKPVQLKVPELAYVADQHILWAPTTWSGDVRVVVPIIVTRTGSLTLQPGTRVFFDLPEPVPGKDPEPWILVQGTLVALGSAEKPILFTAVEQRTSELYDMINVQDAKEAHLRNCEFERGPWALHVHNTPVEVLDSTFRNNYGGVRFQGDKIVLRGNRFENNRIGMRGLKGSPVIEENVFTNNLTGLFFREGIVNPVVRNNSFDNREYDVKLGEAQTQDVDAARNWWASAAKARPGDRIFDGEDSAGLGFVATDPVLAQPWGAEAKKP